MLIRAIDMDEENMRALEQGMTLTAIGIVGTVCLAIGFGALSIYLLFF